MKRDWDTIRDVLIEVEVLDSARHENIQYGPASESDEPQKDAHGVLLWKAGFIEGIDASDMDGDAVLAQGLTWAGHDLLETIRSKAVWERIKSTAKDKGIELTFDAVKALGKTALAAIIGS
ncbi:TPA: DUF2513 domain-containing protein [Pseudomonas aeruginosa]|uniref:DUF2513 domain-containing protein n=1 Tax=Pseudomonas aeruginosa TaxID=287 RepID=UPI0003B9B121|nr:DUF2513 domain-containing protein [Pseudomonas aeruginosa]ERY33668.1 hypothetical protein Q066_05086 [Pseudomonas aeruginosa BL12]MBI8131415.1 DUF2513 domain-containing protein [Pseudomonas aeruginosa]MBI8477905.1 DUF2513 domain-containing protein [Pseudomonas aeruginosa]MBI8660670.1 DUF2513 domain-containing protein [Pseudomonas aeruginosa]MBI8915081.1 DUF2513 domain-containing protein [Pseudomonas aeruginosa]